MTVKAIYRDVADPNNQFSGLVVRTADGWRIQTDERSPRKIDCYIQEKSAVGGMLEFVNYEIYPQENLRPADLVPYINSVRATLPWPSKPAEPPKVQTNPEDTRLHIEPRQPGQSSFTQLKEAAHRAGEVARAAREPERREMLEKANQHDPHSPASPSRQQPTRGANATEAKHRRIKTTWPSSI